MHIGYGVLLLIALIFLVVMLVKHGLPCFWRVEVEDEESESDEVPEKVDFIKKQPKPIPQPSSPVVVKKPRKMRTPPPTIEVIDSESPIRNDYLNIRDELE